MPLRHSHRSRLLRVLLAACLLLGIAISIASPLKIWDRRLYLAIDDSPGNMFSVLLWFIAAFLAATLAARNRARLGWISVGIIALAVAIAEARDFKDEISAFLVPEAEATTWMLIFAPLVLPFLFLAARTLWSEARSLTQRTLLISAGFLVAISLVLDVSMPPIGVAEEGSELMASLMLIAVLLSVLSWVPLVPNFISWRLVALAAILVALPIGVFDSQEHIIRVAGGVEDKPEIHHGPMSLVSQTLRIERDHLSRIDVWAESTGGAAELFLRLGPPGHPPIRESRAVTRHPRWSNQAVTFDFAPIPASREKTYEVVIGSLHANPHVFVGLSTDDPIPESVVQINRSSDPWENDLALRLHTPGRGLRWVMTVVQDRGRADVLRIIEVLAVWLWIMVALLWLYSSTAASRVVQTERRSASAVQHSDDRNA